MTNELILGLTGQLNDLLDEAADVAKSATMLDLEQWLAIKDDLDLGDDAIFATFEAVGTDARFLDEVACDSFAVAGLQEALRERRTTVPADNFPEFTFDVLTAAYRGFLHLRLLRYFDDVLRQLPLHLASERVDPLKSVSLSKSACAATSWCCGCSTPFEIWTAMMRQQG